MFQSEERELVNKYNYVVSLWRGVSMLVLSPLHWTILLFKSNILKNLLDLCNIFCCLSDFNYSWRAALHGCNETSLYFRGCIWKVRHSWPFSISFPYWIYSRTSVVGTLMKHKFSWKASVGCWSILMTGHNSGSFTCLNFNYLNLFFISRIEMSFYICFRFVGEWKPRGCQTLCYLCLFCLFRCAWLELRKWLIFLASLWLRNHIFLAGLLIKWMRL